MSAADILHFNREKQNYRTSNKYKVTTGCKRLGKFLNTKTVIYLFLNGKTDK